MAAKKNGANDKKIVRKTPVKKATAPKTQPVKSAAVHQPEKPATTQRLDPAIRMKKSTLLWVLIPLAIIAILFALRSYFIAAIVNGQPITRMAVIHELENQGGKSALNSLYVKTLITQEANKQHVSVSQSEVDAEVKKIEDNLKKQGQNIDQVLAMQQMTRQSLEDNIRLQKLIEKMVGKDIKVSDKEVNDYIEKNKDTVAPEGSNMNTVKAQVKQQLYQQKLNSKVQSWVADVRSKAKITCFVSYCP